MGYKKTFRYSTGNPIVDEVGTINFTGNVIPMVWFKTIRYPNGAPHNNAIHILGDIVYWYRPKEEEYNTIDEIREIRNYWCHQCYLDFIYIENDYEREKTFQTIAQKLHYDEYRTYDLFKKTEEMRLIIMRKYR